MNGKITFVGAGPGAVDLITLRGAAALDEAELVVYAGSLVNEKLLERAAKAELVNSAKLSLPEVIEIMAAACRAGKRVVRLHTGDPAIYGAVSEQFRELDRLGIPYEVVPGVSSAFAAAAELKVELTMPELSQSVILTRMAGRTPVPEKEALERLAEHGATLCIYLSAGDLDGLVEKLASAGLPPETPAAVVYRASWPNQKIVRAYGHEDENMEKFDTINEELRRHTLKATFFSSITNPATRFVNSVVYAAVALIGAFLAVTGQGFTIGMLSCFLSYANQYTKPFNEISGVITELQNALACADRLLEFLDSEEMSADPELLPEHSETAKGQVTFDNVCFSYTKDRPLIRNFSLDVPAGCRVAIVGPTGCGKTTMINLLMRFYDPDSGSISVDGTNTQTIPRRALRRNFGMVLQETWLKTGTVLDNIRMGRPDASEEDVIAAAKAAHAHSFIEQLPNGYYTQIGEDGGSLSAGQKQLLCISRIMLTLPPMLILDEATSSIDTRTELRIQRAFAKLMRGRTSFVVAHRLSTIKESDVILVMRDGNIVEQGDHESLLAKNGFYAELYRSQFTDEEQPVG